MDKSPPHIHIFRKCLCILSRQKEPKTTIVHAILCMAFARTLIVGKSKNLYHYKSLSILLKENKD